MAYYSEEQTLSILNEIGIDIRSDTSDVWMGMCPFHANENTPAFAVNKFNGTFICFNGACAAQGDMVSLVGQVTGLGIFASHRLIARAKEGTPADFAKILEKQLEEEPMPEFEQHRLDRLKAEFWKSQEAQDYLARRGFTENTMMHYGMGYSPKRSMITTPMHDSMGNPVGIIGRSINSKRFSNSKHLPRKQTLWNIHRAKRQPKTVITEANLDSQRVWQATGIESVAVLGSHFSALHAAQLNKYFTHLVIMTDDDQELTIKEKCRPCRDAGHHWCIGHNTGLELGMKIARECRGLNITWAHLDSLKRYDGMKDAGDMSDDQIADAIENAVSHVEMVRTVAA